MSDRKSRAEQLLAELDCHVTIDQRADALKAIEAYLVDAYEAGAGEALMRIARGGTRTLLRHSAEAYVGDSEQP